VSFINSEAQLHSPPLNQEIALWLDDLLLRELQETTNSLSLKELQMRIPSTGPVTAIMLAASLNRLCRKGKVVRKLVGEGRAHYVYSTKSTKLACFSKRGDA
jgi:predicted DNA-binding transcriptional regulator